MTNEDIFSLDDLNALLDKADSSENLAKTSEVVQEEEENEIKDFDFSMNSPSSEDSGEITNLDFLSRMMSKNLRGYFKANYRWLVKKFSNEILSTFMDICNKVEDADVEPDVFDVVLKDMGITDLRHDIILNNYVKMKLDKSRVIEKSTYERFREIVYKAYFDSVNNGNAVDTLEKIQSSEFFLPPYGVIESDSFKQVDFGDIDIGSIVEDLGSPLYSHFKEINDVSPIHGYIPSQVTMIAAPPSCFVGSTRVRTPEGIKTLYELNQDHRPPSVMYTNLENGKVDWTWDNKGCKMTGSSKELLKLFVSTQPDFPIVCTKEHQFLVVNLSKGFEWVEAQNLKYGDILMSSPMKECVKVLHTEVCTYAKEIPLYDVIDNGEYHNYFINAGKEDICVHNCFTGDTKVMTLDGSFKTMKELNESGAKDIPLYSYNFDTGEIEVQPADECKLMRYTDELCEITFDSGEKVRCTPDHMFPLLTGETVKAKELREGDILLPIHRKHQSLDLIEILGNESVRDNPEGYEVVFLHEDRGPNNSYTHRLVAKFKDSNYNGRCVVHHDDYLGKGKFNHKNNSPDKIILFKNQSEHLSYHKRMSWKDDFEGQRDIVIKNLPDALELTIGQIKDKAIELGTPDLSKISEAFGCSLFAIKSRVYQNYSNTGEFAKDCGFFPLRAENNKILGLEELVDLARKCGTYKTSVLAKESGLPPYIIQSSIKKYFNDSHGFAHSLGYTYRGKAKDLDISIDDLSNLVKKLGPSVKFEDLMDELEVSRDSIIKLLNQNNLTFNEFLSMNGFVSPNITYIIDRSYYYGSVNLTKLAKDFMTSEENINSILEDNGWTVETLTRAIGNLYSNHKVIKVTMIKLDTPEPVYDLIDVKHNHNFAVMLEGDEISSSGVFALQSGKTLFMMTEAVEALKQGKRVLYAAIGDLKPFDFVSRMCSIVMKIPMSKTAMNIKNTYAMMCKLYPYVKKNLKIQFISPNKYTADEWYKMIEQMGLIDSFDVFFIDYDTNFASEKDSMYAKGDEVYTMAFRLSQHPGKYVFIASQPKVGTWKDQELGLESASESSRKQQIVDVMITISHDREVKNPKNHIGVINIPKNRRGGNTSFSYFLDPTGIMMSITPEGRKAIKDDTEPVSVVQTEYWDKTTHLLPNAAAHQELASEQNIPLIGDGDVS